MSATNPIRRRAAAALVRASALLGASPAGATPDLNTDATGYAIRGYDPVAYFTEGRPVRGRADQEVEHGGGKYLFASEANRNAFRADPTKYAPQYGGFCAYGVAVGKKFDVDPGSFKVVGGKLYLNLNPVIFDKWNQDISGYVGKADQSWGRIRDQAPSEL